MKRAIRLSLLIWPSHIGVPIFGGLLKGKLLPKETVRQHLQMWVGRYESIVVSALLTIRGPIKIAYDVGAHVGYMTLALTETVSKEGVVFAFDPVPNNQALIKKLVHLNNLDGKVQIVPFALGDSIGKQRMVIGQSSLMNQLESESAGKIVNGRPTINTAISTLDSFVLVHSNPPPDLIKIDVEGAEAMVIEGGLQTLQRFSPKLLLEIHGPGNADRTYELLHCLDYEWRHLKRAGSEKILNKQHLLSFFSKYSWTHHFMAARKIQDLIHQDYSGFTIPL
jgi:FkbM family methyltransferase